jgi:hypothetical protein
MSQISYFIDWLEIFLMRPEFSILQKLEDHCQIMRWHIVSVEAT